MRYLSECGVPARMERIRNLVSMPISARLQLDDGSQVPCITHAYAASTPAEGLDAPLIELDADAPGQDLEGKIVVLPGLAAPKPCYDLERRGAAGLIFINSGEFPHNMAISPIWGMPTRGDLKELAQIPVVSVNRHHGQELLASMHSGAVNSATLVTRVETSLRDLPLCVADVIATGAKTEGYVLLNGHVDSWHKGAIDNGTGNAAMIEIARVLSAYRDRMTANVRFVWWSGHSNGRYSGSDWYADHNWEDLHANAVVNFNIDAVGAKGATHYGRVDSSAQCFDVGYEAIHRLSGQEPQYSRIARNGDQSFWGHGVPSLFQVSRFNHQRIRSPTRSSPVYRGIGTPPRISSNTSAQKNSRSIARSIWPRSGDSALVRSTHSVLAGWRLRSATISRLFNPKSVTRTPLLSTLRSQMPCWNAQRGWTNCSRRPKQVLATRMYVANSTTWP